MSKSTKLDPLLYERYPLNDLRNIMFETIDETYAIGKYGQFRVQMIRANGYVNATKLCEEHNKSFIEWREENESLIKYLSKNLKVPVESLFIEVTDCKVQGTYVHQYLVDSVARWCSTSYALWVGRFMLNHESNA